MIRALVQVGLLALALGARADASNFSVSGPGTPFPTSGTGGGTTWPTAFPPFAGSSTVTVPNPVGSITSVVIDGLQHTYLGDVQFVLWDPNGVGHNIVVRPGNNNTSVTGSGGSYLYGTFTFVEPGTPGAIQLPTTSPFYVDESPGTYEQAFGTGPGLWSSGNLGVDNAPLSTITGPAGTWTLTFYDWWAYDTGSMDGWTLNGTDSSTSATPFCVPGSGGVMGCVCGNPNGAGAGCANTGSGGASLGVTGSASLASDATDPGSFVLNGTSLLSGSTCIFLQGDGQVAGGTTFGAGIRCVAGQLLRLYVKQGIVSGAKSAPQAGDRSISNRSSDIGAPILAGSSRTYQIYYRDPGQANPGGSCPVNDTFNISTGQIVVWAQ
jgi:hypothetical protein